MRTATLTIPLLFLLCLFLRLPSAWGQPPAEPPAPKPSAAVQTLLDAANKAAKANKPEESLQTAEQAFDTAKSAQDIVGQASALRAKAQSLIRLNRAVEAVAVWKEAAAVWEQSGDGPGQVEALGQAGVLLIVNKPEEAQELLKQALKLGKAETKRPLAAAGELDNTGIKLENARRLNEASANFTAALAIQEKLAPNSLELAGSLNGLGSVATDRRDLSTAEGYLKRALGIQEKLAPNSLDVARSFINLGNVAHYYGDLATAEGYYKRALIIQEKLAPDSLVMATNLYNLGIVAWKRRKLPTAEGYYKRALIIQEKLAPDSLDVASSLNNLGIVAKGRANLSVAEGYLKRALGIQEKLAPNSSEITTILYNLGNLADTQGHLAATEGYYKRALTIQEKLEPNSLNVAISLNYLGNVSWMQGNLSVAENYYKRALALKEQLAPNSLDVAGSLNNLGNVAWKQGHLAAAEGYYKRSLTLKEQLAPNSLDVAGSLYNLSNLAIDQGDLAAAEEYLKRSLTIQEKLAPDSLDMAKSLYSLGIVARKRGDLSASEDYLNRALALQEKQTPNSLELAGSLNGLGNVASHRGDLSTAEGYHKRALGIQEKLEPNSLDVAGSLNNLGLVAWKQDNLPVAEDYYKRALAIWEKLAPDSLDMARSLNNLGLMAVDRRDFSTAEDYCKRALALKEQLAPNSLEMASSLYILGLVTADRGDISGAIKMAQQAWNIVRQQAQSISGDEARQAFGEAHANYAAHLLQYQVAMKNPESTQAAFLTLEQGRAQALQQLLIERRLLAGKRNNSLWNTYELAVRQRDRALSAVSEVAVVQSHATTDLAAAKEPGTKTPPAEIARLQATLKQAITHFEETQATYVQARVRTEDTWKQVKAANPRTFVRERSLSELQQSLPSDTLFVAFSIGNKQSHLFLLRSSGSVQAFVLPLKEKDLEQQIRSLRVDLTDPHSDPAFLAAKSRNLFAALFPLAARKEIAAASRLLLSPDGSLWNLPFAALVTDLPSASTNGKTTRGSLTYLGETKPITCTQSLSLFAQVRQEKPQLAQGQKPEALVLGDPVFVHSPPVLAASSVPPSHTANSDRALPGERGFLWDKNAPPQRLEQTRKEALQIAKFYGTTPLLGEQATEAELRKHIEQADILHLATHGYFHPKVAMASGILLTPPAVEPPVGATNNDGALQAWEIFSQLHLRAELVVLSACETGLGKNVVGEGVIGLTRALQYAGCRSSITSQWQVNDASTATLMTALHQNLRAGMAKDEALQKAMGSVRADKKTSHPYYWAAFFLTGDPDNAHLGTLPPLKQAKK